MVNHFDNAAHSEDNVVFRENQLRICVITSRLIRIEKGPFTDLPTQCVWTRNLGTVSYQWSCATKIGYLHTECVSFRIDLEKGIVISAELADGLVVTDFRKSILPGTARTLDMANGATKLEKGILSRSGGSTLDDSKSLLLDGDTVLPRPACSDLYYFAYGNDHLGQLRDYYRLTGSVPLIPKFALGNWWSRYKAYTQDQYQALMQTFIDRRIPITVATIDMDWHWVDVKERFGKDADPGKPSTLQEIMYNTMLPGWTGYSWNEELFPDHRALLAWLHDKGFRVPLNVHPSQGIRPFENCYEAFCRRLGIDPEKKQRIPFDITDSLFREAYFEEAHRPLEREGADFWWIDWQQGKRTNVPGLDPLWALNHYHTLDMEKQGKRPLILSRYAGLGSHRYPLGFSGDSFCTWKSLAFQPYFTSTASNAGYSWWSHDIGGHQMGIQDDELYLRWLQFGVFSPVNRLHSSNSEFMGKEPWQRSWAVCHIAEEFLRLRHKMIPYLYSANYMTHTQGIPLCMPVYYQYDCEDAHKAKDQYLFGSQLLVCPITKPLDKRLNLAWSDVWLPEGTWTDVFTNRAYRGGSWVRMYRDLDSLPVLAKEGAIVPMYSRADTNNLSHAQPMDIHVWRGNGEFALYEDDGETMEYATGKYAITNFRIREEESGYTFTILPSDQSCGLLPERRKMRILFRDIADADVDPDYTASHEQGWMNIELTLGNEPLTVHLTNVTLSQGVNREELRSSLLTRCQGSNFIKSLLFTKDRSLPSYVQKALSEYDHFV